MKNKKDDAFVLCSIQPGKSGMLKTKKVKCVLCGEACYFSGSGAENMKDFKKGKLIKLTNEKFNLKIVCTDCMHHIFVSELTTVIQDKEIRDKIVRVAEDILEGHIKGHIK